MGLMVLQLRLGFSSTWHGNEGWIRIWSGDVVLMNGLDMG